MPSSMASTPRCRKASTCNTEWLLALVRKALQAADSGNAAAVYGNILKYAQRFPQREMGVMLVSDLHRAVGRPLFAVPAFAEWANSITDLVLYEH